MKSKRIKFIIGILILVVISFSCYNILLKIKETNMYSDSNIYPDSETLTVNIAETPQIPWNTVDTSTYVVETFASAVYGSLTEINESGTKENSDENVLLESYGCDKNICYLKLKKGIKFHNGREVNAYDVEFSFVKQLLSQANDNFAVTSLQDIEGIKDFYSKNKNLNMSSTKNFDNINYPSGLLKGVEVVDKYNLVLKLTRENKFIFQKLSTGFLPIVPIEEFKDDYKTWKNYPVGFGKYQVVKGDIQNHEFVLKRFVENDDIPKFVRFIFSDNDIGDIRVLSNINLDSKFDGRIVFPNIYVNGGFLFNFNTKLGSDLNFRKAISLAIDRDKVAATSHYGELVPEDQLLPNFGWQKGYRADIPVQKVDLNLAKNYLSKVPEGLWKNKVFDVHTFWPSKRKFNQLPYIKEISSELENIGIKVKFYDTDLKYTRFSKTDQNVLWWTGFDTETDDPNANFAYFKKDSFFNNIYPENDTEFENLYNDSVNKLNTSTEYTKKLSQYFTDKSFMVVVFNLRKTFAYNKSRIEFLGNQYSGIKLEIWKIKLKHLRLF